MKAALNGDRVVRLSKELPASETAGEFIGVGVFRAAAISRIVDGLDAELAAGGHGSYFEAAVNRAIEAGLVVRSIATAGRAWAEIDFPADLALARSLMPRLRP
jgi:choline kinase